MARRAAHNDVNLPLLLPRRFQKHFGGHVLDRTPNERGLGVRGSKGRPRSLIVVLTSEDMEASLAKAIGKAASTTKKVNSC